MMNDLHDDLLEMFRRREGDVRSPVSAPTELVGRARRRQRRTGGIGAVVALLVVAVSLAGLRSLGARDSMLPGDTEPTTTKTVSGITITYPEQWFAEDPVAIGIEPTIDGTRTLPTLVLTLTRDDPRNEGVLGCPLLADVPAGQSLMTVQETPLALSGEASAPWPVPLRTWPDMGGDLGCYPGWSGMRASWTAEGRSFEARLGFSPEATDADRSAMQRAFASMTFAPGSVATGETVTLGSGTAFDEVTWSLTATLDPSGVTWTIQTDHGGFGASSPQVPQVPRVEVYGSSSDGAFVVAVLPGDVRSVELETGGQVIGDVVLFSVLDEWGSVRFAVIPVRGSGIGEVRFLDLDGTPLYPAEGISWGTGQN